MTPENEKPSKTDRKPRNGRRKARPGRRQPLAVYDRLKFLGLLVGGFVFLVVSAKSKSPLYTWYDSYAVTYHEQTWMLILVQLEMIRQVHYFVAEHSARYWSLFQRFDKGVHRPWRDMAPFTRHRLSKLANIFAFIVIGGLIAGKIFDATDPLSGWMSAIGAFWSNIPQILQIVMYVAVGLLQFVAIFWFMSKGGVEVVMPEDVKTSFDDVWGQDQVVTKVRETIKLLDDPERIEQAGGHVPSGILLWGPPGTGKTLIAEAMAGETGKPFVMIEPGAFQAMFFGVNILKVKSLYRKLRKLSLRYGGVVAFFDEADVLGRRGLSGVRGRGFRTIELPGTHPGCGGTSLISPANFQVATGRADAAIFAGVNNPHVAGMVAPTAGGDLGTLNAILASMQGLKKPRGILNRIRRMLGMRTSEPPKYRILHVMATNMPDSLDDALLRPGRIDRHFRVGYPSREGRIRTLRGYLGKVQHNLTDEEIERIAVSSPYASGAVIKDTVNEALMACLRDGREVIQWADVVSAKSLKEYGVTDGFEYIDRERHAVAVHEACHALVAYRKKADFQIDVATIERRGDIGGFVAPVPTVERMFDWKSHVEIDIQIFLASIVGERYFFDGDNSIGVGSDLEKATRLALAMESHWGMGTTLASHSVLMDGGAGGAVVRDKSSDKSAPSGHIGERVETRLRELYEVTGVFLKQNRIEILSLAHALEAHGTLSGADIEAVIDSRQGPSIDGTVYSRRDVQQSLEAYHGDVLQAHKSNGGSIPIPRFENLGPDIAPRRGSRATRKERND